MKYDLCLQGGGLGKIKPIFFNLFKIGVLNCHPGKLPKYRGSSAPEYQIFDKKKIIASYHLIGNEIDSGRMIKKIELNLNYSSYHKMRASLYRAMSQNLLIVLNIIDNCKISSFKKIDINKNLIRSYIGDRRIENLMVNWDRLILEI